MNIKKGKELNVDYIGEQGTELTKKEKETIRSFIRKQKEKRAKESKQNVILSP